MRSWLIVLLSVELTLFGRQLEKFLQAVEPLAVVGIGAAVGVCSFIWGWRGGWFRLCAVAARKRVREIFVLTGVVAAGALLMAVTLRPAAIELSHIVVFGSLGASLAVDRFAGEAPRARTMTAALLLTTAVGMFDELLQWIHPQRVADVRDVALNACGGALGVLAAVVSRPRRRVSRTA